MKTRVVLPAMALVCLLLAGVALRLEGGSTFSIGGNFTKWMLWCVIMLCGRWIAYAPV